MNWQRLDVCTRVGFAATAIAVIALVVPPISVASAVVAIVASGVGWQHADDNTPQRSVARTCLLTSGALLVLLVVGNLIYAAAG